MRFVYFYSLVGVVLLGSSFLITSSAATSVIALPPFDTDPAPGRSPGPPNVTRIKVKPTGGKYSNPNPVDYVDGLWNNSSADHITRHRRLRHGHRQRQTNENWWWAVATDDGRDNNHRQQSRRVAPQSQQKEINKLVALGTSASSDVVEDIANSDAFQMKTKRIGAVKKSVSSELQKPKSESKMRQRRHHRATDSDLSHYHSYPMSNDYWGVRRGGGSGGDGDTTAEDADDWHYVNLFCGGDTEEERGSLRTSFYDRRNEVVITMPPQDNRLLPPLPTKDPWLNGNSGHNNYKNIVVVYNNSSSAAGVEPGHWKSVSGQPQQLTTSPGMEIITKRWGTGADSGGKGKSAIAHRFQKVTAGTLPDKGKANQQESPSVAINVNEMMPNKNSTKRGTEEQQEPPLMSGRLKTPPLTLTSLNVAKDTNGQTNNNKLPLQFDVTHDVFLVAGGEGGLVTDIEYTGEQWWNTCSC